MRPDNTEILVFEAEKGLLQGHAKRQVAHTLKSAFRGKVREGRGSFLKASWCGILVPAVVRVGQVTLLL